jgi:hypothetical protein
MRIPLIKVFDHPWVKHFEEKYNLKKSPSQLKNQNSMNSNGSLSSKHSSASGHN